MVWPALLPPWKRTTYLARSARTSTTFPFPSSPHCVPMTAVTGIGFADGGVGYKQERWRFPGEPGVGPRAAPGHRFEGLWCVAEGHSRSADRLGAKRPTLPAGPFRYVRNPRLYCTSSSHTE